MLVFRQAGCHAVYYTTTPLHSLHTAHSLGVIFLVTRHSLHLSLIVLLHYKALLILFKASKAWTKAWKAWKKSLKSVMKSQESRETYFFKWKKGRKVQRRTFSSTGMTFSSRESSIFTFQLICLLELEKHQKRSKRHKSNLTHLLMQ